MDYAKQYGRRWDPRELSAWVAYQKQNCTATYGCVTTWRQIYYDDGPAMKARYDLINRAGLRGAGIWALGYDGARTEMRQAIAEKFLDDQTAPLAGVRALPPTQPAETFWVSWVGSDESGIADYDVQVSVDGGPWLDWATHTTATSLPYSGAAGHGAAFRVRARDSARQRLAVGRLEHVHEDAAAGGRRVRDGRRLDAERPGRGRHRLDARHDRRRGDAARDHVGAGERRRLHVARGLGAGHRVGPGRGPRAQRLGRDEQPHRDVRPGGPGAQRDRRLVRPRPRPSAPGSAASRRRASSTRGPAWA